MKKSKQITLQFYSIIFLFLLVFSICMILIVNLASTYLGNSKPDVNEILQKYLTTSVSANADELYCNEIDLPMEELFTYSPLINFYFSTEQYPIEDSLFSFLETHLTNYTAHSKFTKGAIAYAAASQRYVGSKDSGSSEWINDMIYKYNSNTLDKTQIAGRKSNTFLFRYQDRTVIAKDLTTLAGSPHAILFLFLDMDEFISAVSKSYHSIPYKASVYDSYNHLLYTNSSMDKENNSNLLASLAADSTHVQKNGTSHYLYGLSNILQLQYVIEISNNALTRSIPNPFLLYSICAFVMILVSILVVAAFYFRYHATIRTLLAAVDSTKERRFFLPTRILLLLDQQIKQTEAENLALRKIVAATSSEAVTSLFSRMIAGQQVDVEETKITLLNTEYGFQLTDIYIAGILYHSGQYFLSAENRYRILNLLNAAFDTFKKKNDVNLCAFLYDERTIAMIASFAAGTSIAKGKAKINALKESINEIVDLSNVSMLTAFGNMYNSILDLSFSYNEAFRGIHYMLEAVSISAAPMTPPNSVQDILSLSETTGKEVPAKIPDENTPPAAKGTSTNRNTSSDIIASDITASDATTSDATISDTASSDDKSVQELLERIYRRAEQIAKLIWDEKQEHVQSLIERTIDEIFQFGSVSEQKGNCKRLVSAVTSHMLSYPFVSDSHLSDVYNQLSMQITDENLSSNDLKYHAQQALLVLCSDFSEALKKQRNPNIMAALDYIAQHYSSPELSLEEIADALKIAPNYLSTIFSKSLGKRLFEYINEYRLEKSIEMLLNTDMSINDISSEHGFGSSRNYIRTFKNNKGLPPGAYRKQHLEQRAATESEEVN